MSGCNLFAELFDSIDGVDNVLKEVNASPVLKNPRLLFVRFCEHKPQLNEFVEVISDQLVNYVIPLRKRREAIAQSVNSRTGASMSALTRLNREAVKLLVKFSEKNKARYGEVGELISYVVALRFLNAVQLGSKIALKTSSEMLVHGVDGLHARFETDGTMTFFLLESKIKPTATDATREFYSSVSKYEGDRAAQLNELRLINDLSNLDELEGEQRNAAKAYFNLYSGSDSSLKRRELHVGSLVVSEESYLNVLPRDSEAPITIHEEHFESLYKAKHEKFLTNAMTQARAAKVDPGGCVFFLIAVPDIDELKRAFAETNNGHVR
ncbi:HamA C-terminal domain-containing protein [Azohydromonas lata]|uniref:DUF1837 domain-containing protein n=1 Tax=Azohydromonas lata TaxID=45677 RepID=A0ABU5IEG4_9BURK|nr:DUF1837 domain-containing protein [Azohydromonas lata]MDZ5457224.1 DUF1837 domain-containing protein [Azohydromonas lata]